MTDNLCIPLSICTHAEQSHVPQICSQADKLVSIPAECTRDAVPDATGPEEEGCAGGGGTPLGPHDVTRFASAGLLLTAARSALICTAGAA